LVEKQFGKLLFVYCLICCGYAEISGSTMEFLALENSSLTEEDLMLTEIKEEIEDEV